MPKPVLKFSKRVIRFWISDFKETSIVYCFMLHIETTRKYQLGDVFVLKRRLPIRSLNSYQFKHNTKFAQDCLETGTIISFSLWLWVFLIMPGDVHPKPGPASTSSISTSSSSLHNSIPFLNSFNLSKHLSFIHYNVQSIANKIDLITTEHSDLDILAFSETWLQPSFQTSDLLIPEFKPPVRKDRQRYRHGGVMIYVKDSLIHKRRFDLEPLSIECIWIEMQLNLLRLLFGLFYRPPKSDLAYFSGIEDFLYL